MHVCRPIITTSPLPILVCSVPHRIVSVGLGSAFSVIAALLSKKRTILRSGVRQVSMPSGCADSESHCLGTRLGGRGRPDGCSHCAGQDVWCIDRRDTMYNMHDSAGAARVQRLTHTSIFHTCMGYGMHWGVRERDVVLTERVRKCSDTVQAFGDELQERSMSAGVAEALECVMSRVMGESDHSACSVYSCSRLFSWSSADSLSR